MLAMRYAADNVIEAGPGAVEDRRHVLQRELGLFLNRPRDDLTVAERPLARNPDVPALRDDPRRVGADRPRAR